MPPSSLQPIQSEDFPPSSFPSKKGNFGWDFAHPNIAMREIQPLRICQHIIRILDFKQPVLALLPANRIVFLSNTIIPPSTQLEYCPPSPPPNHSSALTTLRSTLLDPYSDPSIPPLWHSYGQPWRKGSESLGTAHCSHTKGQSKTLFCYLFPP